MKPGVYHNISNADYHSGPGISKSQLDLVAKSPALLEWNKSAPEVEKSPALVFGDACHALILEPERFSAEYAIAPNCDRRTNAGKAQWDAAINDAAGKSLLSFDDGQRLTAMRESVMAHPEARRLIEAAGEVESSVYWNDADTGILCRCRPDKNVSGFLVDLKTTRDMDNFSKSVAAYRYHVQDALYSDGYQAVRADYLGFCFVVVGSTLSMGRYPVRVFQLDDDDRAIGRWLYKRELATVKECQDSGEWWGIERLSLPNWAKDQYGLMMDDSMNFGDDQ